MSTLTLTSHAVVRMAQRSINPKDSELIALIGTSVDEGYVVREKDYQDAERLLKAFLQRLKRLVGKRLVVADGHVVTAYHASNSCRRRLLRSAHESDFGG
jgi:hypothetical protein